MVNFILAASIYKYLSVHDNFNILIFSCQKQSAAKIFLDTCGYEITSQKKSKIHAKDTQIYRLLV